jgi:nucleotidyltransferase/DNA polymerase involved in DNA repair
MGTILRQPRFRWEENFVSYRDLDDRCFIYCDTNASFVSIHQFLEGGVNKPCVVANGKVSEGGDAGACLAISYEARGRGLRRGASLMQAKKLIPTLVVYESCLPLYDIYAKLCDRVIEWIVPQELCYRGSCDEVVIVYERRKMPVYRDFSTMLKHVLDVVREQSGVDVYVHLEEEKLTKICAIKSSPRQIIFGICILLREMLYQILGLPISIGVAPSLSLAKALIDRAKPQWVSGKRVYQNFLEAIAFPQNREDANAFLRSRVLTDICGVKTVAKRVMDFGYGTVGSVQDQCGLDDIIQITRNKHLGKVLWYSCHGRDEFLPGYLANIRDRK